MFTTPQPLSLRAAVFITPIARESNPALFWLSRPLINRICEALAVYHNKSFINRICEALVVIHSKSFYLRLRTAIK